MDSTLECWVRVKETYRCDHLEGEKPRSIVKGSGVHDTVEPEGEDRNRVRRQSRGGLMLDRHDPDRDFVEKG